MGLHIKDFDYSCNVFFSTGLRLTLCDAGARQRSQVFAYQSSEIERTLGMFNTRVGIHLTWPVWLWSDAVESQTLLFGHRG